MKLPRSRRITDRSEFQNVRAKGRSIAGRFLVLGYLHDDSLTEPFRLGLITTKKLGNAVVRNRIRRKVRGIFHRLGDRLLPGHWIVIVARNSAAGATSEQLEKEWKWLMHRASLMQPSKDSE